MSELPPTAMTPADSGKTLAAVLRALLPGLTWSQVRALIAARRVKVREELCLDPARRLKAGDLVEVLSRPLPRPREPGLVKVRFVDSHLVVVEKPAGVNTVRHPAEREWTQDRKALAPTLEDMVWHLLGGGPRLRIVHRLDKETSGLVVFARTVAAERGLGKQFHAHSVVRRYLAVVPGEGNAGTVRSFLVRDRGDGRRGSVKREGEGKEAITHIAIQEALQGYTLVSCRLETGRTHQIRIHLAEQGTPVCGDKVYCHKPDGGIYQDRSGAARLALHAVELGFVHPVTHETMHWEMPPPEDMHRLIERLRRRRA